MLNHAEFVETVVVQSVEGAFSLEELREADGSLKALGVSSVQYMNILDAIEGQLGIVIEPDVDPEVFETVAGLAGYLDKLLALDSAQ